MKQKLVVVGAGMASGRALEHLLEDNPESYDVTLFGAEPRGNYNRIMLSPVLGGEKHYDDIITHDAQWYARNAITCRFGETVTAIDRSGIARDLPSRTDRWPELRGTKHRVAREREVLVAKGRRDGRPIVIVPEVKDGEATAITLLHVRFADRLPVATARAVLQGYRSRYAVLHDAVRETEPTFREDLLADTPVEDLLTEPINQLADRWRTK